MRAGDLLRGDVAAVGRQRREVHVPDLGGQVVDHPDEDDDDHDGAQQSSGWVRVLSRRLHI